MKNYKIIFSVMADGCFLLWDIINGSAIITAETRQEAKNQLRAHCERWGYNPPAISEVIEL